jgi:hypothetical protein
MSSTLNVLLVLKGETGGLTSRFCGGILGALSGWTRRGVAPNPAEVALNQGDFSLLALVVIPSQSGGRVSTSNYGQGLVGN